MAELSSVVQLGTGSFLSLSCFIRKMGVLVLPPENITVTTKCVLCAGNVFFSSAPSERSAVAAAIVLVITHRQHGHLCMPGLGLEHRHHPLGGVEAPERRVVPWPLGGSSGGLRRGAGSSRPLRASIGPRSDTCRDRVPESCHSGTSSWCLRVLFLTRAGRANEGRL